VYYKKQELLTLPDQLDSPPDLGVSVMLIFFVSVLSGCVPNVASVSVLSILGCPFGFSNDYLAYKTILSPVNMCTEKLL
jgi:hypothetical protein